MSKQQFIQGYSQYQLEALKIPNASRGECLTLYVPYWKCLIKSSQFERWLGLSCHDQKAAYSRCYKMERQRNVTSGHLMRMKLNNAELFQQLNVAPALATQYNPSFLNYTRH